MEHSLPDDVLRVTEAELQEKLSSYLDRVAHADEELVVVREGEPTYRLVEHPDYARAVSAEPGWAGLDYFTGHSALRGRGLGPLAAHGLHRIAP